MKIRKTLASLIAAAAMALPIASCNYMPGQIAQHPWQYKNNTIPEGELEKAIPGVEMLEIKANWNYMGQVKEITVGSCTATTIAEDKNHQYLLTAAHCTEELPRAVGPVIRVSETRYEADGVKGLKVLVKNPALDYAVLKAPKNKKLKVIKTPIGNSNSLWYGDHVTSIGYPQGLDLVISDGIVSNIRYPKKDDRDYNGFMYTSSISPGNSGGPLFVISNDKLHLIGITISIYQGNDLYVGYRISDIIKDMQKRGIKLNLNLAR